MAGTLPWGTFTRGRREWHTDELAQGGVYSTGGAAFNNTYLGNNTKSARDLAVYAICAWRSALPQIMLSWIVPGLFGGVSGDVRMLEPAVGQIEGAITVLNAVTTNLPANGIPFVADGKRWFSLGDVPLFVIPGGSSLVVVPAQYSGNIPANEPTFVSFLWGLYRTPRPPRVKR